MTLPAGGARPGAGGSPNGSAVPNGQPGGRSALPPGVDQATMDKARAACQRLQPALGAGRGGGTAFQAYASCMKDHGVTIPARGSGAGSTNPAAPPVDRTSPAYVAANNACQALLPARGSGAPGGATTTTTTKS